MDASKPATNRPELNTQNQLQILNLLLLTG